MSNEVTRLPQLTDKQKLFCHHYVINGHNATQAYLSAGYHVTDAKDAGTAASQLLAKPHIKAEITKLIGYQLVRLDITHERVLYELACMAFFDIADVLTDEGKLKPVSEIPEHARRALANFDLEEIFMGKGEERIHVGHLKKFKVHAKDKALELLMKYQGMLVEKVEHEHKGTVEVAVNKVDLEERIKQIVQDQLADALQ